MDFLTALQQLLPPGIAINPESLEVHDLLHKTAKEFDSYAVLEQAIFSETDPRHAKIILQEYERSLGLPSRCTKGLQTIAERRAAVYNQIIDRGGIRRTRYLGILSRLGQKNASIERFKLYTCDSLCTDPIFSERDWLFTWAVNVHDTAEVTSFTCQSQCSEPLGIWGNTMIECELDKEKPAYSIIIFRYLDN